ncbi:MAG: hypothetical protein GZ088_16010 [Acidipila sp.]|nr:hypothetical protein [Acidipila sp.]
MAVFVLRDSWERGQGVLGFPSPLSPRTLLFFPNIEAGAVMHMRGVVEPLNVFFLDKAFGTIRMLTLQPEEVIIVPAGTAHVVELSTKARPPQNFEFLKTYR